MGAQTRDLICNRQCCVARPDTDLLFCCPTICYYCSLVGAAMQRIAQNEAFNIGLAIAVPFLALLVTSVYVILTPNSAAADLWLGRIVAIVVLAFFVWSSVRAFNLGKYLTPSGEPGRHEPEEIRSSPLWAFVIALLLVGLIVAASGPAKPFASLWPTQAETAVDAPAGIAGSAATQQISQPPATASGDAPATTVDAPARQKFTLSASVQLLLLFGLIGVLLYFSIHISRLDNKINQRETSLISHSYIYFLITLLNLLVIGSPTGLGFLSTSVGDYVFTLAWNGRFLLVGLGALIVLTDAIRVWSASHAQIREATARIQLPLPAKPRVRGVVTALLLIFVTVGRFILRLVNLVVYIIVYLFLTLYHLFLSVLHVVRTAIFSWALLFALIHSVAFAVLAAALLAAPHALSEVRSYFSGTESASWSISLAIAGVLGVSIFLAVIAFISAYFSWPGAFFITVPETIAYTLIAVWLNSLALHALRWTRQWGPSSFDQTGWVFWGGLGLAVLALAYALFQNSRGASPEISLGAVAANFRSSSRLS